MPYASMPACDKIVGMAKVMRGQASRAVKYGTPEGRVRMMRDGFASAPG